MANPQVLNFNGPSYLGCVPQPLWSYFDTEASQSCWRLWYLLWNQPERTLSLHVMTKRELLRQFLRLFKAPLHDIPFDVWACHQPDMMSLLYVFCGDILKKHFLLEGVFNSTLLHSRTTRSAQQIYKAIRTRYRRTTPTRMTTAVAA